LLCHAAPENIGPLQLATSCQPIIALVELGCVHRMHHLAAVAEVGYREWTQPCVLLVLAGTAVWNSRLVYAIATLRGDLTI
jgi:hypothetical protein